MKENKFVKKIADLFRTGADKLYTVPSFKLVIPILIAGMYLKNILLQCFIASANPKVPDIITGVSVSLKGLFFSGVTLCLIFSFLFVIKKPKNRMRYTVVFSILMTVMLFIDTCYYRTSPELPSVSLFKLMVSATDTGHMNPYSFLNTFSAFDVLYLLDYLLLGLIFLYRTIRKKVESSTKKEQGEESSPFSEETPADVAEKVTEEKKEKGEGEGENKKKSLKHRLWNTPIKRFACLFTLCALIFASLPVCSLFGLFQDLFRDFYHPAYRKDSALFYTPIGYHLSDIVNVLAGGKKTSENDPTTADSPSDPESTGLTKEDRAQIRQFYEYNNENLPDNQYAGIFNRKNVLIIQVESLENFVIGEKINGIEITPNLNRLVSAQSAALYFTGIHDQVKGGNSSDCDLMVNASLLPTSQVFFLNYFANTLPTMPSILRESGYKTYYINGSGNHNTWHYEENYTGVFGYESNEDSPEKNFWLLDPEDGERVIYRYISDRDTLSFALNTLSEKAVDSAPYYAHMVLCSSHTPFDYRDFPETDLDPSEKVFTSADKALSQSPVLPYLNDLHYVDEQIGIFLENAEEQGLLDNTVVVIYGDHTGIHKYNPDKAEEAEEYPGLEFIGKEEFNTVPLIIYDPTGTISFQRFDVMGGQVDIMPTLMYLLGINRESYKTAMGRVLVNTNRNYTILPNGIVLGDLDKDDENYRIVYRMYNTADLIAEYDYFSVNSATDTLE